MTRAELRKKRFWSKVDIRGEDECWPWRAARHVQGYGAFAFTKHKITTAHRVAWAITYNRSRLPSVKFQVMHKCDNKLCVNPNHLERGTASQNNYEAFARYRKFPRRPILQKYCKRGHRRTHSNTMIKVGGRHSTPAPVCRTCVLENNRLSKERLKSPERTARNSEYMRQYRARKKRASGQD